MNVGLKWFKLLNNHSLGNLLKFMFCIDPWYTSLLCEAKYCCAEKGMTFTTISSQHKTAQSKETRIYEVNAKNDSTKSPKVPKKIAG